MCFIPKRSAFKVSRFAMGTPHAQNDAKTMLFVRMDFYSHCAFAGTVNTEQSLVYARIRIGVGICADKTASGLFSSLLCRVYQYTSMSFKCWV